MWHMFSRALGGYKGHECESEHYRAFMRGLKPHIWQYVGPNVRGDLDAAILMAEQFDLYASQNSGTQGKGKTQTGQGKGQQK